MSLPSKGKPTWTRIIALAACLIALATYSAFSPAPSRASIEPFYCSEAGCKCECTKDGKKTTEGGCVGNQTCQCMHGDNGCYNCGWTPGCS